MTLAVTELLKKALALPPEARPALAGSLRDSLDTVVHEGAEAAWEKEIETRLAGLNSGEVVAVPWTEVRRRLMQVASDAR